MKYIPISITSKLLLAPLFILFISCNSKNSKGTAQIENDSIKAKKVVFIIVDGIPADQLERIETPNLDSIAGIGAYARAITGGIVGGYSETPTISAVGYNSLLTGTWANKHNVWGNGIKNPNYNYWHIFRLLKEAKPHIKTGVFSTWLDNRTKLLGDTTDAAGKIAIDYVYDGYELDTIRFPQNNGRVFIQNIDDYVAEMASKTILEKGPDLSWVYLEYTDDMGHAYGDSPQFEAAVEHADGQIGQIWRAINTRMNQHVEDWMIVITTDHGRKAMDGKGHGGQSERERTIWITTNKKTNSIFKSGKARMVDIMPSILEFMEVELPDQIKQELDGLSFLSAPDFYDLNTNIINGKTRLIWKPLSKSTTGKILFSKSDYFKDGKSDVYKLLDTVELQKGEYVIPDTLLDEDYVKIVLNSEGQTSNIWVYKDSTWMKTNH